MRLDTRAAEENARGVVDLPPPRDPAYQNTRNDLRGRVTTEGNGIADFAGRTATAEIPVLHVRGEAGPILVINRQSKVTPGSLLPLVLWIKLTAVNPI